ncbi:hypothetical protein [Parasediminibacterium sp. JCM 36343]|uniref:hypothetical protein n=1 Tax=Parasediminibacterium sp. JCM 36343 TaxID=3374279 RepID=UPI00397DB8FC
MKKKLLAFVAPLIVCVFTNAQTPKLTPPPQDAGLPYTRSARPRALEALKGTTALFAGSRYAYVNGYKIRLDTKDILRAEAVKQNGKIFVPEAFATIMSQKEIHPKPIPKGLEVLQPRWVYEVDRPAYIIPASVEKITINGAVYFAADDLAKALGKQILLTKRGLLLISDKPITYQDSDPVLSDCIVSIFDTPEKLMDPDIATKYVPTLKAQGKWTDHARVKPEDLKALEEGKETEWPVTPKSQYDYSGFNQSLLGSKVPAPGVYPRLLFSPEDLPMLRKHISENKTAQKSMAEIEILFKKTWFDPTTSDGKLFDKLASGDFDKNVPAGMGTNTYAVVGLTKDFKPGIQTSHTNYITNCLTTMALYCLLTDNETLGKKVADALCNYYIIADKLVENHLRTSDSEFGISGDDANNAETVWRGMIGMVPHMDLALSLDYAGKYMTAAQRKFVERLIAKATYGRVAEGGDGPRRGFRDVNHVTWHLTHYICEAEIEGLDGFDPEGYATGSELTSDFLEWGIDNKGQMFESNGKSGGGFQFEFLSMLLQARRGDNLFGHPHFRKMLTAQVYTTSPNRKETLSSGTWGGSAFSSPSVMSIKSFYPNDRAADYLLQNAFPDINVAQLDLNAYKAQLEKKISGVRLPGTSYPGFVFSFPYVTDWKPTTREDLKLPTIWNTETHGILSASSDNTENATWLCFHTRNNHYIGSGHHHADIGMFYFSGLGVNWITESPSPKAYSARYHNEVIIDGKAEAEGPAAGGDYLGANLKPMGAFSSENMTYSYTYQWCTQVPMKWGEGFSTIDSSVAKDGWELETRPDNFKYFVGTTHYKMRYWWPSYNFSNFVPNLRALWNPVEYVYRSAGLIKGNHPYSIIVDDAKKDANQHLYQWTAMTAKGVWKADYKNVPKGAVVLAHDDKLEKDWAKGTDVAPLSPKTGDPLLLVYSIAKPNEENNVVMETVKEATKADGIKFTNFVQSIGSYNRLAINKNTVTANFKVLLIPFKYGEELPTITTEGSITTIAWKDGQKDVLDFAVDATNRTKVMVMRDGKEVVGSK